MAIGPSLGTLTQRILEFRDARDWKQFHNPKDLAISLALEANEVLEFTQWKDGKELGRSLEEKRAAVGAELSDVLYWTLLLAHELDIDLEQAFDEKMTVNASKYPVAKARGNARKYSEL